MAPCNSFVFLISSLYWKTLEKSNTTNFTETNYKNRDHSPDFLWLNENVTHNVGLSLLHRIPLLFTKKSLLWSRLDCIRAQCFLHSSFALDRFSFSKQSSQILGSFNYNCSTVILDLECKFFSIQFNLIPHLFAELIKDFLRM